MQRTVNVYVKIIIISILAATCYIWAVKGTLVSRVAFHLPKNSIDDRTSTNFTSTDYRYEYEFQKTLKKYTSFDRLYQEEISTAVPGLEYTEMNGAVSSQMVPQGICIAGEYMLITAYDNGKNAKKELRGTIGYSVNNSVIYVISNANPKERTYLTTIILPDVNHVGGITFDGKYVWIAKSTTKKCSAIDYKIIEAAVTAGESSYRLESYTAEAYCGVTASFITYYDEQLWVGTFRSRISGKGSLQSYEVKEEGGKPELIMKDRITIPAYANGVAFAEVDGRTCMSVVSSSGRYGDSKIYLYEVIKAKGKNQYISQRAFSFPPMAEEMVCDGENTYFLFESAATCYSTSSYSKCSYPVDRISGVNTSELFSWARNVRLENVKSGVESSVAQIAFVQAYLDSEKYRRIWALVREMRKAVG